MPRDTTDRDAGGAGQDEPPVLVRGLVARYGQHEILRGVDVTVRRGSVHVILGGSGSGKSTLLRHIIGLKAPHAGSVHLLGVPLCEADEPVREATLSRIGMLFQNGALLNAMTVAQNVALPIRKTWSLPEPVVQAMVQSKLALVGLEDAAERMPRQLSGGMVKRAALARAMARDPEVLFCDEPSAGLDPVTAAMLDELLLGLRERFGMTIVVVTHELASIKTIADHVTMLGGGVVIADGALSELEASSEPTVRAFFDRVPTRLQERADTVLSVLGRGAHDAAGESAPRGGRAF